jgi:hypothetical protein
MESKTNDFRLDDCDKLLVYFPNSNIVIVLKFDQVL